MAWWPSLSLYIITHDIINILGQWEHEKYICLRQVQTRCFLRSRIVQSMFQIHCWRFDSSTERPLSWHHHQPWIWRNRALINLRWFMQCSKEEVLEDWVDPCYPLQRWDVARNTIQLTWSVGQERHHGSTKRHSTHASKHPDLFHPCVDAVWFTSAEMTEVYGQVMCLGEWSTDSCFSYIGQVMSFTKSFIRSKSSQTDHMALLWP